jgi:hypothetical protein
MERVLLCLAVATMFLFSGATDLHAQDLTLAVVDCPKTARAGQDLKSLLRLLAANSGESVQKNIALEIVVKKSPLCPKSGRSAAYSPNFYDGVLLRQGREFVSMEPGKPLTITPYGALTIPGDIPVGRTYYLCAVLDPENLVKETNKENNCACCPIKIIGTEESPLITNFVENCLVPGNSLTILGNNFGPETGTVTAMSTSALPIKLSVSFWSDTRVVVLIPNDVRIKDGQRYSITILKHGGSVSSFTAGKSIAICPVLEKIPEPRTVLPPPPLFLYQ